MSSRVGNALDGKVMEGLLWIAMLVLFGISVFFIIGLMHKVLLGLVILSSWDITRSLIR
jgi:hypothetical protein